jgi:hypothetical protein
VGEWGAGSSSREVDPRQTQPQTSHPPIPVSALSSSGPNQSFVKSLLPLALPEGQSVPLGSPALAFLSFFLACLIVIPPPTPPLRIN